MTVQDIAAISETIGAAAVVVTLIYLAVQTRQSRIAAEQSVNLAKVQATSSVAEAYSRWRTLVATNPALVGVIAKANSGGALTEVEKIQISQAFEERIVASWISFASTYASGAVHSTDADIDYLVEFFRINPAALIHWNRMRMVTEAGSPEFVYAVDAKLEKIKNRM
ncbi:MAG: hypothetical protein ACU84Q_21060 [Gammaproteobacteria bacterium]